MGLFCVFTFGLTGVWVVGVFPGRGRDGTRGGSCVFSFVMGLYYVNDGLESGFYLVGDRVTNGGKVGLVLGPGLEASRSF